MDRSFLDYKETKDNYKTSLLRLYEGIELNTKELPNCETHLNAMCVQMNTRKKQDMLDWN